MIKICQRIIEYSFYSLFLLVPLAFTSATSELFELNKMWLVWALTIIIGMSWLIKMILQKEFIFKRTPLDIPIALFLVSQVISTIFSLDSHTSFWGYYSRFNGGLLSIISYILLYYAFLSNLGNLSYVRRLLGLSLMSGLIVALWGLPSHFGYDPTCLIFRGTLDVSCWTADFMPRVRIFSTLGQPNWLAAYLAILIPIAIAFTLENWKRIKISHLLLFVILGPIIMAIIMMIKRKQWKFWLYLSLTATVLFYIALLYTLSQSGFVAIWIAIMAFAALYFWVRKPRISFSREKLKSPFAILLFSFLALTFVIGTPIGQLNKFSLDGIGSLFQKVQTSKPNATPTPTPAQSFESGGGGTESGKIRLLVWEGAINTWKANPIFGTGVETFAFAYYKYKPAAHNLTSEWNFLYNKAHNEYLNYLATTGVFGLGTYLLMIGSFLFLSLKRLKTQMSKLKDETQSSKLSALSCSFELCILSFALLASYLSILVTNFLGFSVVITNVYLFMIPAFVFVLAGTLKQDSAQSADSSARIQAHESSNLYQWTAVFFILIASLLSLLSLFRFWRADIAFALGYNLDRAGEYQQGYPNLRKAVQLRGDEPVFKDELSLNNAIIAAALVAQKPEDSNADEQTISVASTLAQEAINTSNDVVSSYPNNVVFWKTRTRLFFTLSQVDSRYLPRALDAIEKASLLAPNDANIWYNLGVLYGQNNNLDKGISALEKTIILKPDYRDAHFGLGLFYRQKATGKDGIVTNPDLQQKAVSQMQYILNNINPKDENALSSLEDWAK